MEESHKSSFERKPDINYHILDESFYIKFKYRQNKSVVIGVRMVVTFSGET